MILDEQENGSILFSLKDDEQQLQFSNKKINELFGALLNELKEDELKALDPFNEKMFKPVCDFYDERDPLDDRDLISLNQIILDPISNYR